MIWNSIEVGTRSLKRMSYDEAVMTCFLKGEGWRLPTFIDCCHVNIEMSWIQNDSRSKFYTLSFYLTPVRDLA